MGMQLKVIVAARPTEKVSNFLSIVRLFSHGISPRANAVDTLRAASDAEAKAASCASAGCYGQPEYVGVHPVVVGKTNSFARAVSISG